MGPVRRIAHRAIEQRTHHLLLDQVVNRPFLDRMNAEILIGLSDQYDDGSVAGLRIQAQKRSNSLTVRENEIQHDDIDAALGDPFERELFSDQLFVFSIAVDQQYLGALRPHASSLAVVFHRACSGRQDNYTAATRTRRCRLLRFFYAAGKPERSA